MIRRALVLLLATALSLGWAAVSADACTAGATAEASAVDCSGCGDTGKTSDCSVPDCTAACAHAPFGPAHAAMTSVFSVALLAAETPRAEIVPARSIPPDIPPPR